MDKGSIPAADAWTLFGLHVDKIGYQAMVIPVICMAFMLATIEKWLHKRLSGTADFLLTPLITILLTGFLTFVAVGPITRVLSIWITDERCVGSRCAAAHEHKHQSSMCAKS